MAEAVRTWSIQEVARLSGVTARTLRYYDEIELLRPARIGANGHRYYGLEQLLRLQRILLLRELDLELAAIRAVVDGTRDPLEALRAHHERLLAERGRLDRLAATVLATITHLERGLEMPAEEMFAGFRFDREGIEELEAAVAERTGLDARDPALADYVRDAMVAYADARLR